MGVQGRGDGRTLSRDTEQRLKGDITKCETTFS